MQDDTTDEGQPTQTQIAIHAVRNLVGSEQQQELFSESKLKQFAETYGVNLEKGISRFGIDLNDIQQRMCEAVLHGFTRTNYKGNQEPIDKSAHAKEKYPSGNLPSAYKYLVQVPKLKATQAEILNWGCINRKSAGDIQEAVKALKHLGTTQYCFYYTRLAFDEEGHPKKDRDGDWLKEEVVAVDTLFTIKEIRSKKTGNLEYYEITPSPLFLDQRESYFMMIPFNWREEVKKLIGQRKASSYTFRFLLFLRYRFELERRSPKEKKQFIIKCTPEEMAINLKMPESIYRRKKDRANKLLDEVYSVAKKLGYLKDYKRSGTYDILQLNEEKYSLPRYEEKLPLIADQEDNSPEMKQAKELIAFMVNERRKLDPKYNPIAGGQVREQSLKHLVELMRIRNLEEVKQVVAWGFNKKYWCDRIGTPSKLRQNFDAALAEMRTSEADPVSKEQKNKEYAAQIAQRMKGKKTSLGSPILIQVLNKYVEIGDGTHAPTSIGYSEKGFEEQLESALRKRGLALP